MGKFRSKLKRHTKGKNWSKGHSSTTNPEQMKHRQKATSRFFQANLSLAPPVNAENSSALTLEAVMKHEQRGAYNAETTTVNDVVGSLRDFNFDSGDDDGDDITMSASQANGGGASTHKTFKTFASNYSTCSNMSFKKLMSGFRGSSELHKEMLAILTALTEIIKERGGSESSTEYFLLLMEQIEASTENNDIIAGISLLGMGIKSVPTAVLRKQFNSAAETLLACLERFLNDSNQAIIKYIIGCLSVLLRAQDYATWTYSSTWKYIDAILTFTIHSKPKIRKAAQHAVIAIMHGSSFMISSKAASASDPENESSNGTRTEMKVTSHPASTRVAKFCLKRFQPEMLANGQTQVLFMLTLLKDALSVFKTDDIRTICEHLLSIMTAANVLIRTNCFQTLHGLFASRTININATLCAKLLAAVHEYRPDRVDVRQTLAWLTVLKEGYLHLGQLDMGLCVNALPRHVDVCANDLWMSDRVEIIAGVTNSLKELLAECVRPACATQQLADIYRVPVSRIIAHITKVLGAPFGDVAKYVILTFVHVFEACGEFFSKELAPALLTLSQRYDTESALRIQIEYAIIAAIKTMGPERVLQVVPLSNASGEIVLELSWLLPLLREGCTGATFKFFKDAILPLAQDCNAKWHKYTEEKQVSLSHTYELLCCQLWGLLPGFCRQPRDPENFRLIAPTLGNALDNNPEFRAPIFDGLIELLRQDENGECPDLLVRYARNFLPRLFNIYTQKPNGTYEADLRKKTLDVIIMYLPKTPEDVLKEVYETARLQLTNTVVATFEYDAIFDVTAELVSYQTSAVIRAHFDAFIEPVLLNQKHKLVSKDEQKLKKQQRKTYELLGDILTSEMVSCQKFCRQNQVALQKLLLNAFATSCCVCQAARLRCLKILIESRKSVSIHDKIVMKTIPEAVLSYKEFSTRKENISEEIIKLIGNLYQEADKLNDFIDILVAGLAGDATLITNTILVFRTLVQHQGRYMTISTLEFMLEQISVFLVQKSRAQAEASVVFLITFIKVMPTPLIANHLETIMKSLSAMMKDTKRYCRIQIGYLLKKLCKRFTAPELIKFVPGNDEVTHRRLKKIRKQMRRETRQKLNDEKEGDDGDSDDDLGTGLEKKSMTIEDILGDSDSDLPEDMDNDAEDDQNAAKSKSKSKKEHSTYIREDIEDIVDLADIKSIGKVLTNRPDMPSTSAGATKKQKDTNRGFKTADDGRLIITDKALRGMDCDDDDADSESDSADDAADNDAAKKVPKRGMEEDSSDEEEQPAARRQRKGNDAQSMRSGKTATTRYTAGGKGIHRSMAGDAASMKSGHSSKSAHCGTEYSAKKAMGDMKKKGKLDPYAYIPLTRNTLNRRKRAKNTGAFKNIVNGAKKGALKGVKNRISKSYKK